MPADPSDPAVWIPYSGPTIGECACARISGLDYNTVTDTTAGVTWFGQSKESWHDSISMSRGPCVQGGVYSGDVKRGTAPHNPQDKQHVEDQSTAAIWPGTWLLSTANHPTPMTITVFQLGSYSEHHINNPIQSVPGISDNSPQGWTWGTDVAFWVIHHPRLRNSYILETATTPPFRWTWDTVDSPHNRDFSQVPWGDFPFTQDEGLDWANPEHPVWLVSTCVSPIDYERNMGATIDFTRSPFLTYTAVLRGVSVFWHDGTHAYNYKPNVFWDNWPDMGTPTEVSNYWMGCGQYSPYGAECWYPDNLDGIWSPGAGFSGVKFLQRHVPPTYGSPWASSGKANNSTFARTAGLKIDGGYSGPTMRFRPPARLVRLVQKHGVLTVNSATANARMTNVKRLEYKLEVKCGRLRRGIESFDVKDAFEAGETYGATLWQRSKDGANEEWKLIFRYKWTQGATGNTPDFGTPETTNTHYDLQKWLDLVESLTSTRPENSLGRQMPPFMPKQIPFVDSSEHAPESVTTPDRALLAHWLIGLQWDGVNTGTGPADRTVWPEYDVFQLIGQFGYDVDLPGDESLPSQVTSTIRNLGPGYAGSEYQAASDQTVLAYVRGQHDKQIEGLDNIMYRAVGRGLINPPPEGETIDFDDQHIPTDTLTAVDMRQVSNLLVGDIDSNGQTFDAPFGGTIQKAHHEYELRPGFPWSQDLNQLWQFDNLTRNVSPWCTSFMPRAIVNGDPGESTANAVWTFRMEGIVFQSFDAWEIKDWVINVTSPEGTEDIRVPTPWDEG